MIFHFTCAPENVDKVVIGLKNILKELRETELSKEKVNAIEKKLRNKAIEKRRDNGWWLDALGDLIVMNQDLNTLIEYESQEYYNQHCDNHPDDFCDVLWD